MIGIKQKGDFNKIEKFFVNVVKRKYLDKLEELAKIGVDALRTTTPIDSGETASSWGYETVYDREGYKIYWTNSNVNNGVNIALIIQLGHGTRSGVWVEGIDYINPALAPVFSNIADAAWKVVTS